MSLNHSSTVKAQNTTAPALVKGVLQRTCACGEHTIAGGQCEACQKEKAAVSLQRSSINTKFADDVPPIARQAWRPSDQSVPFLMESHSGYDLTGVPLHGNVPEASQSGVQVNEPGDQYELEADRVAHQVMQSPSNSVPPSASSQSDESQDPAQSVELRLQRKEAARSQTVEIMPDQGLLTGGDPLPADTANFYEGRFGRDFSQVRVHSGETSAHHNVAVNAHAFTYGHHIWLGQNVSVQPSFILAHELAHVVQQTQPPPLDRQTRKPMLSPSPPLVQRFAPYWEPYDFNGTKNHALILPKMGEKAKIFTEAPVANADRLSAAFDKVGSADLYEAKTTVGVYYAGHNLPKRLKSQRGLMKDGGSYAHVTLSAPQVDEKSGRIKKTATAPADIKVGDLKPSHGTIEALEGTDQVKHYLEGFTKAREETNAMPTDERDGSWASLTTGLLPKDLPIPERFKEPAATGQTSTPIVLKYFGRAIQSVKPRPGKVYVKADRKNAGIWNYVWAPDTPISASQLPTSVTALGAQITTKIVDPLTASPVKRRRKEKSEPKRTSTGAQQSPLNSTLGEAEIAPVTFAPIPHRIQRAPRPRDKSDEKAVDSFDLDAWKADHARLTGEEKKLEKTPDFQDAETKRLAVEDREAAINSGYTVPPAVTSEEKTSAKAVGKLQFWTGASSAIFGYLRYWFGGAFVKVVNAYHAVRNFFQEKFGGKANDGPSGGGLLGKVIQIAFKVLKVLGKVVVGRTVRYLVDSVETGVEQMLKSLIPDEIVEGIEDKIKTTTKMVEDLKNRAAETVESLLKDALGPYAKIIDAINTAAKTVSAITNVVDKVRWGARLLACVSPPLWGCLWNLAEAAVEKFAAWLIDACWFQKAIAPLIASLDFITVDLPKTLAGYVINLVKRFLPEELHGIFGSIDKIDVGKINPDEVCADTYKGPSPEQIALAKLVEETGEEKWSAWVKLTEKYGIDSKTPLTVDQIEKMGEELKKTDVAALKEAADLYPALAPEKQMKVVNLTTFLGEVKRVQQEMISGGSQTQPATPSSTSQAGGGDSELGHQTGGAGKGDGGSGGIVVPASAKDLPGEFNKPINFEIVAGVGRGDYVGNHLKVDVAAFINGEVVTLPGVAVIVKKRVFIPNEFNPERGEIDLQAPQKDQFFNVEELGAAVVNKIRMKGIKVPKGRKYHYVLQLKGGK